MKKERYLYIYLFRHGETTFNRDKRFTGWLDAKLTKNGIKQAKIIALKLKNKKFNYAFQTRLSRSKDTLKQVMKYHKNVKIMQDDRMIERNYGDLNGHYHEEIIKKYGKEHYEHWHRGFGDRPPKGESFEMVEKRVKPFIKSLIEFMKINNSSVAISAHGNSIRLFRKIMEKSSIKETCSWSIPYDKVFVYKIKV